MNVAVPPSPADAPPSVDGSPAGVRQWLADRRTALRHRHRAAEVPMEIAAGLTNKVDEALRRLIHHRLAQTAEPDGVDLRETFAVVATGGYGSGRLAPFSDVDVVFLLGERHKAHARPLVAHVVRDIWDAGLTLGQNVATVKELVAQARDDVPTATGLLRRRHVFGERRLSEALDRSLARLLRGGWRHRMAGRIVEALAAEQAEYGRTAYLLEPDVKRTAGGLRDVHLIGWLGMLLHHSADPRRLEEADLLGAGDADALTAAYGFLTHLRHELHFHAGKAEDLLTRAEQVRIARLRGYGEEATVAVERFLHDHYRHATCVADVAERCVRAVRRRSLADSLRGNLTGHRVGDGVQVVGETLVVAPDRHDHWTGSLERVLALANLAAGHHADFDRRTYEILRRRYLHADHPAEVTPAVATSFLELLDRPGSLELVFRRLHRCGVLERLLPEFEHVRCRPQFNAYHKYTVDEHTLVMLGHAERLEDDDGLLGRTYRSLERKGLLHLAVLLHDLGKGRGGDHSVVGAGLAAGVAERFGLDGDDTATLVLLVRQHLAMSHFAYHRDTSQPGTAAELARVVGAPERLRLLYVLTVCDTMAVGPGTLNGWKADLLADLFRRTLATWDEVQHPPERNDRRAEVRRRTGGGDEAERWVEALPADLVAELSPEAVAEFYPAWQRLEPGGLELFCEDRDTDVSVLTILTHGQALQPTLCRIAGCLVAGHLDVVAARIHTLADGSVLDSFRVLHPGGVPAADVDRLRRTLRRVLVEGAAEQPTAAAARGPQAAPVPLGETRIGFDNDASDEGTVIDVFTDNRPGLLYRLTRRLADLELDVRFAKIATYCDQAMDVFYVTDAAGRKLADPERLARIRTGLADALADTSP